MAATKATALVTLGAFAVVQWLGLRSSSWTQQATSLLKGVALLALVVLRRREPDLPRPFRVPGYPWAPMLTLVVSAAFLIASVASDLRSSAIAALLLLASYPAYRFLARGRLRSTAWGSR